MQKRKFIAAVLCLLIITIFSTNSSAQNNQNFSLTDENLQAVKSVELDKLKWRYQPGDNPNWATLEFDDSGWEEIEGAKINPQSLPQSGWNGRGWFRLKFNLDEKLAGRNLALIATQTGASEIYLDGKLLTKFGEIKDVGETEYNPNRLPIIFRLDKPGEHLIAVRFSSSSFADMSRGVANWLTKGGAYPKISLVVRDASDLRAIVEKYAGDTSMRGGFLFAGFLFALALLHFLLYLFYRIERANLYYSFFAGAFAINIICGNFRTYGHLGTWGTLILSLINVVVLGVIFTVLPAFLLVAFYRPIGRIFWALTGLWVAGLTLYLVFLNQYTIFRVLPNILISLSFTYCIFLLIKSLRERRPGAWILFGGVFALQLGMLVTLLSQFGVLNLPEDFNLLSEFAILLGVPVAVSIFLARNFARTNRDLKAKLIEVELLSQQKIEQERHAAELRVENERRAKELEEARQLQLSMLPAKLPQLPNLKIGAYMKPATEVGGDYYDFHIGEDGTLTIAVGDATGHGLKAGTVVTATKGLFNNLAPQPYIPSTLSQISRSLKSMNLRGLFMAMTILKIKGNNVSLSSAGMPSILVYREKTKTVEEIALRALPLGSVTGFVYRQMEITLSKGDMIVLMSDGFPEMFNEQNELLGYDKAEEVLLENSQLEPQELINQFLETAKKWAGSRPQDDDVTFVVLKMT